MPTPAITFTVNGPTYIASEKAPLIAPAGATVKIVVDPGAKGAKVYARDNTRNPQVMIDPDLASPYQFTVTVPGPGHKRIIGIECRANGAQIVKTQFFTIVGAVATDSDPGTNTPPVKTELPPLSWGIAGNQADGVAKLSAAVNRVKADGGEWGRLWHSHFGAIDKGTTQIIASAAKVGVKTILCVQPKDGKPYNLGTPDFNRFVSLNADVLRQCEYVEAGNELHCFGIDKYRPDDLGRNWHAPYVERWLKPLAVALRTIGVKTMLTSTTDVVTVEKYQPHAEALKAAGACDWCDVVATHVYAAPAEFANVAPVLTMLRDVYGKPVVITEAAPSKQVIKPKDFPAAFKAYAVEVRKGEPLAAIWYRGLVHPNAKEWPKELSLFDSELNPTVSYAALLSVVKG